MSQPVSDTRARRSATKPQPELPFVETPKASKSNAKKVSAKSSTTKSLQKNNKDARRVNKTSSALEDPTVLNDDNDAKKKKAKARRTIDEESDLEGCPKQGSPQSMLDDVNNGNNDDKADELEVDSDDNDAEAVDFSGMPKKMLVFTVKTHPGTGNPSLILLKDNKIAQDFTDAAGIWIGQTVYDKNEREYKTGAKMIVNDFLYLINSTPGVRGGEKLYTITSKKIWTEYFADKDTIERVGNRELAVIGYSMRIEGELPPISFDLRAAMYGGVKRNIVIGNTYNLQFMFDTSSYMAYVPVNSSESVYTLVPSVTKVDAAARLLKGLIEYGYKECNIKITVRGLKFP